MKRESANLAYESMLNLPIFVEKRVPKDALDFGDERTTLLSLKRRSYRIDDNDADPNNCFGVYLGESDKGFAVGVHVLGSKFTFTATEVFDTIDEMKAEWVLD